MKRTTHNPLTALCGVAAFALVLAAPIGHAQPSDDKGSDAFVQAPPSARPTPEPPQPSDAAADKPDREGERGAAGLRPPAPPRVAGDGGPRPQLLGPSGPPPEGVDRRPGEPGPPGPMFRIGRLMSGPPLAPPPPYAAPDDNEPLDPDDEAFLREVLPEALILNEKMRTPERPGAPGPPEGEWVEPLSLKRIVRELRHMKDRDPEAFEDEKQAHASEIRCRLQAMEVRGMADGPERQAAVAGLRKTLEATFDLRLRRQEKEAERLARALDEVRANLKQREANREKIVDRRLDDLLNAPPQLRW